MPVLIGTSGWQYEDWRQTFYPKGVAQPDWLGYYSARFDTVEINSTFYRLPSAANIVKWRETTPESFLFSVKVSRYVTHIKRLRGIRESLSILITLLNELGSRCGPLLLQLPPNLAKDLAGLESALVGLQRFAVAVEPRHRSWYSDDVADLLSNYNAAFCLADRGGRPVGPLWRTADWGYVRFHAGRSRPEPCYGRQALASWADRCAELWSPGERVFAYFNNDTHACALRDARVFAHQVERSGVPASTVPGIREVRLADAT